MTFDEILAQVRDLVQSKGRVAYRALKRRFEIDDEYLEDLKAELIDAEQVACDEDGKVLVWIGEQTKKEKAKRGNGETEEGLRHRMPPAPSVGGDTGRSAAERR